MPTYSTPPANATWQTAPAPTADAWFQPVGGRVFISTDDVPSAATAGVVTDCVGYPVASGTALKYRSCDGSPVSIRMWDR